MTATRTLLLTGASRGIGRATVRRLNAEGWRVNTIAPGEIRMICCRGGPRSRSTARSLCEGA